MAAPLVPPFGGVAGEVTTGGGTGGSASVRFRVLGGGRLVVRDRVVAEDIAERLPGPQGGHLVAVLGVAELHRARGDLVPGDLQLLDGLAAAQRNAGQREQAEATARQVLARSKDDAEAYLERLRSYARSHNETVVAVAHTVSEGHGLLRRDTGEGSDSR